MTKAALTAALVCCMSAAPAAHQLDEYLQATRIHLSRDRVAVELDLTPGAAIATQVITVLDRDADGRVSPLEARAYGETVLLDLTVQLDGRAVAIALRSVDVAAIGELREGTGNIHVKADGRIERLDAGRRRLRFANYHRPEISIYLANAMISDDRSVSVAGQARDARQHELRVDYHVAPPRSTLVVWMLVGLTVVAGGLMIRPHTWMSEVLVSRR